MDLTSHSFFKRARIAAKKALKQSKSLINRITPFVTRVIKRLQMIWFNLSTAQKLYCLALVSLVFFAAPVAASWLSVIALVVEFWPKFNKLWHSLAGKAVVLIFYATIANFVLASASGIVNEVTLVSADHFNYTHNFATLLYLPPWALGITLATLLILQLVLPLYILALLMIKPFGSDRIQFITQSYSPLVTALVRFFLATVVMINIIAFVDGRSVSAVLDDITASYEAGKDGDIEGVQQQVQSDEGDPKSAAQADSDNLPPLPEGVEEDPLEVSVRQFFETKGYFERSKRLIALFAYNFEANSHSRCQFSPGSRVVELNDYELVEIRADETQPYGYSFVVKACSSAGIKAP